MEDILNKDKKNLIKDNEILNNYIKEFSIDVSLNIQNIKEKSLMCSSIWAKWLSYLFHEKENLDRLNIAKQKIIKLKSGTIKNSDIVLRIKSENSLIQNDETIAKINSLTKNVQSNIDYIERALNILQNFGFQIKNSLDYMKLCEK